MAKVKNNESDKNSALGGLMKEDEETKLRQIKQNYKVLSNIEEAELKKLGSVIENSIAGLLKVHMANKQRAASRKRVLSTKGSQDLSPLKRKSNRH
jgi:hypothetical protein